MFCFSLYPLPVFDYGSDVFFHCLFALSRIRNICMYVCHIYVSVETYADIYIYIYKPSNVFETVQNICNEGVKEEIG